MRSTLWLSRKTIAAWNNNRINGDAIEQQRFGMYPLWELVKDQRGGKQLRCADQVRFLAETMRNFNKEMTAWLRNECGLPRSDHGRNWKTANQERLLDAERWTYAACDIIAKTIMLVVYIKENEVVG